MLESLLRDTMSNRLSIIIVYSFYLLFFLVPLFLTHVNFELFEYNKMMLTYALTVIISTLWLIKIITIRKPLVRTPLDLPLLLFLLSQIVSTIFSWDRHVSIFGYYSRFNGGLLSSIAYTLLYFSFVNNFPKEKIKNLLTVILVSGFLVSVYGILERLGIDKNIWIQDVQNRVFSTLGQPNWLAAYLTVLIPLSLSFALTGQKFSKSLPFYILSLIFFMTLIFTKSRSGMIAIGLTLPVYWIYLLFNFRKKIITQFIIHSSLFLILIFIFGSPFAQINRFTLPELTKPHDRNFEKEEKKPLGDSIIDIGITESGTIRKYVWQGAIDVFKHYPLIGTGVETFAFSFYKYRPAAHNLTSEWDFLYNKAHNEFLNYAATTGVFGLGSYLLFIGVFIVWMMKRIRNDESGIKNKNDKNIHNAILIGFFAGWLSIAVTNFFGFSVVITQLFFYLIPSFVYIYNVAEGKKETPEADFSGGKKTAVLTLILACLTVLLYLGRLWLADFYYARGHNKSRIEEFGESYKNLQTAIKLNGQEPLYYDELAYPSAQISLGFLADDQATQASKFQQEALASSDRALAISPNNVIFWKTKTRVLYGLSKGDSRLIYPAIEALEKARELSWADPKIRYNLALMYDQVERKEEAFRELENTIKLKIDFRDAYLAQALFYNRDKQKEKALKSINFILTRLNPNDAEAKQVLEEIK